MKIKTSKGEIVLYDSIDELTFERFNSFNKYVMLESELGSTVGHFDKKVMRLISFVEKDMKEEAKNEVINMRMVYNNILQMNNTLGLSFACLVKSIKGNQVTDFSTSNLNEILSTIDKMGVTVKTIKEGVVDVKKKSKPN